MKDHETPMLSAETSRWVMENSTLGKNWSVATSGRGAVVQLPSKTSLSLQGNDLTWSTHFDARRHSDNLWLFSLHYLPEMFRMGMQKLTLDLAVSFYSFSTTQDFQNHRKRALSSWDHATALRIEAMSALYAQALEAAAPLTARAAIYDLLRADLEWAFDHRNIRLNNHGLMLATAVLTGARVIGEGPRQSGPRLQQYGADCIARILTYVFGDDGYCNENSPYYSLFYLRKLRELRSKHAAALAETGTIGLVDDVLRRGASSLSTVVYSDGGIPPLGDSHRTGSRHPSTAGTFVSRRTGFWVHKDHDMYVSLKCGGESATHKHVDDSSMTLQYRSTDIFMDSGYHSYTSNIDTRVRALKTQIGHSGLFFRELDDSTPAEIYRNHLIATTIDAPDDARCPTVVCSYTAHGRNTAYRTVQVPGPDHVVIVDDYHTLDGWSPVQRFILPAHARVTHEQGRVLLAVGGVETEMSFHYPLTCELVTGEESHPHRGWAAMQARTFEPTSCLEITPASQVNGPLRIDVKFRPLGDDPARQQNNG